MATVLTSDECGRCRLKATATECRGSTRRRFPRYAPGLYRKARREPHIVVSISKLKCFAGKKRHFLSRNDKFSPLRTTSEGAFSCEFETNQTQELRIALPMTLLRG